MKQSKPLLLSALVIMLFAMVFTSGCNKAENTSCTDGIKNGTETGIDCGGSCSVCVPPNACFTSSKTTASIGEEIFFTNCSTGGTSYLWNFGDGNTSTAFSPSHRYLKSGTHIVTLKTSNADTSSTKTAAVVIAVNSATYAGNYKVVAACTQSGNYAYDATIGPSGGSQASISNFYNKGQSIMVDVSGSSMSINNKAIFGITFNGSGSLSADFNTVTITYTAVGGPYNDNCTAVYTRY